LVVSFLVSCDGGGSDGFFVGFLQLRRDGDNLVVGSGDFSSSFSGGGGDSDILVVSCCSLAVARQFGCWSWRFFLAAAGANVLLLVVGCFFLRLRRDGEIIWLLLDLVFPPSLVATVVAAAQRRDGLVVGYGVLLALATQQLSDCWFFLSSAPTRLGIWLFGVSSFTAAGAADKLIVGSVVFPPSDSRSNLFLMF
jgi:hypothetical protein